MADTYTHKDLASLCGVSETTIKSYRRKFPGFIPVLTRGKPIRFKEEAGSICLMIRDCFAKGMSVNETLKVLKENFKEEPVSRPRRTPGSAHKVAAPAGISQEYMEKFFATAGQMMQGMAGLATAQAKAEQRLRKVESTLEQLLEHESRNSEVMQQLMGQQKIVPEKSASAPESSPKTDSESPVRARKIVNVRTPEGAVNSYSLEKDTESQRPSDAFLNTPIVIKNDVDEFLGVPGRLPLSGFVEILTREAEEAGVSQTQWYKHGDVWVFIIHAPNGESQALYFSSTTTPRGNLVVLLERLDVNEKEVSSQFLQEYFRQVKDKI
ncbi:DNA-binding protein [Pseudodesulfovibrio sp. JC047]|uniref:helix-turn-helix domain-containing protein n=1 Tax=Pseudodesulfovibrio sp. JC047 TaxID=2683199 RepID=UPI0013D03F54|nr:helix-turn-helix domain-containing protein [Pseudodesulfovibrio sp. JC047]NDV19938.1 DNA-binding protein [Pseudodesulfovibrio sp. JC047]